MNTNKFFARLKRAAAFALTLVILLPLTSSVVFAKNVYVSSENDMTWRKFFQGDTLNIAPDAQFMRKSQNTDGTWEYYEKFDMFFYYGFDHGGSKEGKRHGACSFNNITGESIPLPLYNKMFSDHNEYKARFAFWSMSVISAINRNDNRPLIEFTPIFIDDPNFDRYRDFDEEVFYPQLMHAYPLVQLSRSDVTGYTGKTLDLDYKWFNMTEPKVTWSSSDESVATVASDGVVTFVAKGKATITLDVENYGQLKCAVNVKSSGLIKRK